MANGAIRKLVRPIEPKRSSRRYCAHADTDPNSEWHSNTNPNPDTLDDSNAFNDTDPNSNGQSGSGSNGKSRARIHLYGFDRYLSMDREWRHRLRLNVGQHIKRDRHLFVGRDAGDFSDRNQPSH